MITDFGKHIFNTERRTLAEKLVLYCGVPANLSGYDKLVDCAVIASYRVSAPRKEIYRTVASVYGVVSQSVIRSVTYAINKTTDFERSFAEIIGSHARVDVHCGKVIAHLGKIIDNPELSPLYDKSTGSFVFDRKHNAT